MRPLAIVACLLAIPAARAADTPLPKVPPDWKIELVTQAPDILYPTACVVAPDGTVYLGQDPMDMPGPPTEPIDSVVVIRNGKVSVFADKLWAVMGLEWSRGTLYVVHAPFLSALTDTDGDGKADKRVDLMTGLGPKQPGFNGINDHVPSGLRLGMDGYLYIAIGDKGIPDGVGKDGTHIKLQGGGVIRIRPDGTGLEVVSTGERNPLSAMLTAHDDIFTYGNDDDSKKWPNSLTHHIPGAHYGYPYRFLTAVGEPVKLPSGITIKSPRRALPVTGGEIGGSGTQGLCYLEAGLPDEYRGNLFVTDWGLATVFRYVLEPKGATFKVKSREPFIEKGEMTDFRPFSIASSPVDGSLYLVDWAFVGWLADGPRTGRLYHLTYEGKDRPRPPAPRPLKTAQDALAALDGPSRFARLEAEMNLRDLGPQVVDSLVARVGKPGADVGRLHALWALAMIGGPKAHTAIAATLSDPEAVVRAQAAKSVGLDRAGWNRSYLEPLLRDKDPVVRREAATSLGELGDVAAGPALMAVLGDPDLFTAWSVRRAIRRLKAWDANLLTEALLDTKRRDDALDLTDEAWAVPVVEALRNALAKTADAPTRVRLVVNLAGLFRRYPEWTGAWFGTNPIAGIQPTRTKDWSPEGMTLVQTTLAKAAGDPDPAVRREVIAGLREIGLDAAVTLRNRLAVETDTANIVALCAALGALHEPLSANLFASILLGPDRPLEARAAALDALAVTPGRPAANARLRLLYDEKAPPELIARALPGLAGARALPLNEIMEFADNPAPAVRAAALVSMVEAGRPKADPNRPKFASAAADAAVERLRAKLIEKLDDPDADVRRAAIAAATGANAREAIPKLLALADSKDLAGEAKLALMAMPDPRALNLYIDALNGDDTTLAAPAEAALLAIRDLAGNRLETLAREGKLKPKAVEAAERVVTRTLPILNWRVIGPFPRTTARVFVGEPSIDFNRVHIGAEGRHIKWQPRKADPATGRLVLNDLKGGGGDRGGFGYEATNSPELAAFGYAEILSETDRPALLLFGSSGSLSATLNEQSVYGYQNFVGRPYRPDSDRVRVQLKKGVNRLVLQSRMGIGTWSWSVQVSDPAATLFAVAPGKLSIEELRSYALSNDGDAEKGRAIFFDPKGVGCVKCHSAAGQGTATVGPDLAGLAAKFDRAEIIRSVLEPSNRLATGYQPVLIARTDGTVVTGLVRSESEDKIDLVDADARVTSVPKSDIEERRVGDVSIMPTGIVDSLSKDRFADLIAFLLTLKTPPPTAPAR